MWCLISLVHEMFWEGLGPWYCLWPLLAFYGPIERMILVILRGLFSKMMGSARGWAFVLSLVLFRRLGAKQNSSFAVCASLPSTLEGFAAC